MTWHEEREAVAEEKRQYYLALAEAEKEEQTGDADLEELQKYLDEALAEAEEEIRKEDLMDDLEDVDFDD